MPCSAQAWRRLGSCKKRWRQRNAVLQAMSSCRATWGMLRPWSSAWAYASHLPRRCSLLSGVPVSALKVLAQPRHRKRCRPRAKPFLTMWWRRNWGSGQALATQWPRWRLLALAARPTGPAAPCAGASSTGQWHASVEGIWVASCSAPVRWQALMRHALQLGATARK